MRLWVRNMRDNPVVVGIAQGKAVTLPEKLITYALGSCVGVCLYDEKYRSAGMAHIMLPDAGLSLSQENPYKFADQGCRQLLKEMERLGASRCFITAKLAGGAAMFSRYEALGSIGERNVKAVKAVLRELNVRMTAEDTGKNYGRTITFDSADGSLTVKSMSAGIKVI